MIRTLFLSRLSAGLAVLIAGLVLLLAAPTLSAQPAQSQATDARGGAVPGEALGNLSDSEMWRKVRQGVSGQVSIPDQNASLLVQSEGDNWRNFRNGPLVTYGAYAMLGFVGLIVLFYLFRGKIRVDHGMSGQTITRFVSIERLAHWTLAISFIVLALTGLNILYGRYVLIPLFGAETFASVTATGKWLHNKVGFAFMLGLVMIILLWLRENIPNRHDLIWLAKGGGLFVKGVHPPSRKFNAGQKIIFWTTVLGGISISLSGIALLFPYETNMFAKTFGVVNSIFGTSLPETLAPIHEMQLQTLWHSIMAMFLICVIVGHIYIGSIGMQGAFDAMGSGEVDINWAKEHHNLWVEEVMAERGKAGPASGRPMPAE